MKFKIIVELGGNIVTLVVPAQDVTKRVQQIEGHKGSHVMEIDLVTPITT
jgi:hypothetical protein